jgi:hypothetical protein
MLEINRGMMGILDRMPRGIYKRTSPRTEEHREHLSIAAKEWWAIPENKERMRVAQTGTHRRGRSDESKKKMSDSMKRYWKRKKQQQQKKGRKSNE